MKSRRTTPNITFPAKASPLLATIKLYYFVTENVNDFPRIMK